MALSSAAARWGTQIARSRTLLEGRGHLTHFSFRCLSSLSAETFTLRPEAIPSETTKLTHLDEAMMHFPGVTTHNFYRGTLDITKLKDALGRVVNKNPGLAGRIRSLDDDSLEVHYDGNIGAYFHVKPLAPELESELEAFDSSTIAQRPLDWEKMVEKLGIANTGPGPEQVDKDGTLCCATYLQGQRFSTLSLSVSHLLGDGATKMMTLTSWDQEMTSPGSAVPLSPRDEVEATDEYVKSGYTDWEQASMKAWYPTLYDKHTFARELTDYNMVVVRIKEETLQKIKKAEAAKFEKGTIFSAQDALIAWIGNVLESKWFSFTVDLRGRMEGLELNTQGNAFMTWFGIPEKSAGSMSAMDVRRTIKTAGKDCAPALEEALFSGLEHGIDVNSWVKLQPRPSFGGDFWKQVRAIGFGSLPFLFRINYHVVYQPQKGEYIMFHFGLRDEQAKSLAEAWKTLGEDHLSITSGADLLKSIKSR